MSSEGKIRFISPDLQPRDISMVPGVIPLEMCILEKQTSACSGLNCPSKIDMLKLNPNMTVFGDRALMEVIKVK